MSEQSESFDKRIADLVAHRTPDELARDLLQLQDAQKANEEERQREADEAPTDSEEPPLQDDDLPEDDRE